MSNSPSVQSSASEESVWLVSPGVDVVIGAGAWSLPLLLLTGLAAAQSGPTLAFAFYGLALVVNYPHFMATIARAYKKSPTHRLVTVWLTVALVVVLVWGHLDTRLLPLVFTLYLTWSPWHYTSQNRGIATLFLHRAGLSLTGRDRLWLRVAFLASYSMWVLGMHSGPSLENFLRADLDPAWTLPARILLLGIFLVAAGAVLVSVSNTAGTSKRMRRGLMLAAIVISTQMLWFVLPWVLEQSGMLQLTPLYFAAGALAFMHGAQYLWVIFFSEKRENLHDNKPFLATRHYLLLVGGGAALFIVGPWILNRGFSYDLVTSFLLFQAVVNIHHFAVDGVIWRLREPQVASVLGSPAPPPSAPATRARLTPTHIAVGALLALAIAVGVVDVIQYSNTRVGASEEQLDVATKLNPHDARVSLRRAEVAMRANDKTRALAILDEGLAKSPTNASLLRAKATALAAAGKFDDAYNLIRSFPPTLRDDKETLLHLAALAHELKKDDAADWAKQAEALAPNDPEVLRHLGIIAMDADKKATAAEYFSRSLVQTAMQVHHVDGGDVLPIDAILGNTPDPMTLDVACDLAHLLVQMGKLDDAEELLRVTTSAAVRINSPLHAMRAVADAGRIHVGRTAPSAGLESLQRALRIAPEVEAPLEEAEIWITLASTLETLDAPLALRYAAMLRANNLGSEVRVNENLRAYRLRKAIVGNLGRMADAMDPEITRQVTANLQSYLAEALAYRPQ